MTDKVYSVAVIGGGSAGVMAALRTVLNNDECLLLPGSPKHRKKSRAFWVAKVENMPAHLGYKKGIMEPNNETLKWLGEGEFKDKFFLQKNRGADSITKLDDGTFEIKDNKEEVYRAKYVILCTGVMDVQPEIAGSIDPILPYANVQIVDYCLRCDGHHVLGKNTSIIGHNSGAAWVAIMLHERYEPPSMTILTHGKEPEFDERTTELIEQYNIKVDKREIVEVLGDRKEPRLDGYKMADGEVFETQFSFVSLGMIVYNELALQLGAEVDQRGFVTCDQKGHTSVEGLYVAGDLRAGIKNQIYTAWDSAVDSSDAINALLRQSRR